MAISFEESVKRLNEIVETLERGDIPLEESIRYFEEGMELVKRCKSLLAAAEEKVEMLMKSGDGFEREPFE
jgi:exodeoxyribonuclease VII small subunit